MAGGKPAPSSSQPIDPLIVLHTSQGDVTIKLFQEKAPRTVENFLKLVGRKFYDGLSFHRLGPHFVGQGVGGPDMEVLPASTDRGALLRQRQAFR